ncbi:thioredoxin-like protein [Plenodomus tracheiphilus IPT5]|uniref:Thioredoxin-like protein n=1 Tax=Plenodomus tracheiphilus IPT5 TaxID=1408161 RepID=A0A6A7BBC8_9PLEO|nr:thioredoxin-like protein [Plenodomus tracheiphilus IPT5]
MSSLGQVRVGHKAPYFECEAVIKGVIADVSINTYIRPTIQGEEPDPNAPWLIIMFIPAAFSFVCPTEVLAFQNCLDEFRDRHCNVIFVSVDTKHSLWHWQNVPRQYGGLGKIDIPLLSDANHRIAKDYGVLIEDEGVSLRGMFLVDDEGIVQQVTLNNLTVGRSVLEALRLLEAFQAVARHGVLCPIDWKPDSNAADTLNTISNTLTESYEERLANLQKEFGDTQGKSCSLGIDCTRMTFVFSLSHRGFLPANPWTSSVISDYSADSLSPTVTDLDAKHKSEDGGSRRSSRKDSVEQANRDNEESSSTPTSTANPNCSASTPPPAEIKQVVCTRGMRREPSQDLSHDSQQDDRPQINSPPSLTPSSSFHSAKSSSAPPSASVTPLPTPTASHHVRPTMAVTVRHSRGRATSLRSSVSQELNSLFGSPATSFFFRRHYSSTTDSSSGHSTAPCTPGARKPVISPSQLSQTYESRRGSHVVLEFADPTSCNQTSPLATPANMMIRSRPGNHRAYSHSQAANKGTAPATTIRSRTASEPPRQVSSVPPTPGGGPTRLQATFEAIKRMSAGLASPRLDYGLRKMSQSAGASEEARDPGYFDVVTEGVEA